MSFGTFIGLSSLNLINLHVLAGCPLQSQRPRNSCKTMSGLVTNVHKLCLFQQGLTARPIWDKTKNPFHGSRLISWNLAGFIMKDHLPWNGNAHVSFVMVFLITISCYLEKLFGFNLGHKILGFHLHFNLKFHEIIYLRAKSALSTTRNLKAFMRVI